MRGVIEREAVFVIFRTNVPLEGAATTGQRPGDDNDDEDDDDGSELKTGTFWIIHAAASNQLTLFEKGLKEESESKTGLCQKFGKGCAIARVFYFIISHFILLSSCVSYIGSVFGLFNLYKNAL